MVQAWGSGGNQLGRLRDDVDQGAVAEHGDGQRPADRLVEHQPLQVLGLLDRPLAITVFRNGALVDVIAEPSELVAA